MSSPLIFMPNRRTSAAAVGCGTPGSAGWMYRARIEWILGCRLRGTRLHLDLPAASDPIDLHRVDASRNLVRILDDDFVARRVIGECDFKARPGPRDTRRYGYPTRRRLRNAPCTRRSWVRESAPLVLLVATPCDGGE